MANQTFDYGELRVTLTSAYDWAYDASGSGARKAVTMWHPKPQGEMCPLGAVCVPHHNNINGKRASLLVGLNPDEKPKDRDRPAVARPTGYTSIWTNSGSRGKYKCVVYRPTAPVGYVSLGDVANDNYSKAPPTTAVWCLRSDLTKAAKYGVKIWDDENTGATHNLSCWEVLPQPAGLSGSEYVPIPADCFRGNSEWSLPESNIAFVPVLRIKKAFKPFTARVPEITPATIPNVGDQSEQREQCRVVLPFTAFYPPIHEASLSLIEKPFCIVGRSTSWSCEACWANATNGEFSREKSIKYGISKSQTTSMQHEAGVEISSSGGIGLFEFGVKLNYQYV